MANNISITIDVISDPVCPWCYIGKKHLDLSLEHFDEVNTEINWHPYQLNPDMPFQGMNRKKYLSSIFGGEEAAEKIYRRIYLAGRQTGLSFNFSAIKKMPNSSLAHILIDVAKKYDKQNLVLEEIFRNFFILGKDIGKKELLIDIADKLDMCRKIVGKSLSDTKNIVEINKRDENFRKNGLNGVPCFIIDNKKQILGAKPIENFIEAINEVYYTKLKCTRSSAG